MSTAWLNIYKEGLELLSSILSTALFVILTMCRYASQATLNAGSANKPRKENVECIIRNKKL